MTESRAEKKRVNHKTHSVNEIKRRKFTLNGINWNNKVIQFYVTNPNESIQQC